MRILTPEEYDLLRGAIPKIDHVIMIDTLFYTGLKYTEFAELKNHREWFDGDVINIPDRRREGNIARGRTVYLCDFARKTLPLFFKLRRKIPDRAVFDRNLKRWGDWAKINTHKLSVKTLRKTWAAYLIISYPEHLDTIARSLGISSVTEISRLKNSAESLKNFADEIMRRTAGWLRKN